MLYELEKKDYSLLEPMLISGFQFPEVSAVIDSINDPVKEQESASTP